MKVTITKQLIVKAVELILVCILMGLLFHSNMGVEDAHLASGTFIGYLIILAGLLLGEILNTPVDIKLNLFFTLIGGALFVAVGIIFLQDPNKCPLRKGEIKGYMSILTGVILFADAIVIILQDMNLVN